MTSFLIAFISLALVLGAFATFSSHGSL